MIPLVLGALAVPCPWVPKELAIPVCSVYAIEVLLNRINEKIFDLFEVFIYYIMCFIMHEWNEK